MKKIFIIGAEGYIGSQLCKYLNKYKNYKIATLDTGYFRDGVIYKNKKSKVNFNKDLRKFDLKTLNKFDFCVCLAGQQNDPGNFSKKKFYSITKKYTLKLAKYCKKNNIKFIFPSSCSIYGYSSKVVNENSKLNPLTHYSKNKVEIEKGLKKISNNKFRPIILRFSTIFGFSNALRLDLLINMISLMAINQKKIILNSNGKSWRPHLHIDYACKAIKLCIDKNFKPSDPQIFNVGFNDYNLKTIDIAKIIKKIKKIPINYNFENKGTNIKADQIVKNGIDKRSYRVNFSLFNNFFPSFRGKNEISKDIKNLLREIERVNSLNKKIIYDYRFFRLQKMERLISKRKLDNNLFWLKK